MILQIIDVSDVKDYVLQYKINLYLISQYNHAMKNCIDKFLTVDSGNKFNDNEDVATQFAEVLNKLVSELDKLKLEDVNINFKQVYLNLTKYYLKISFVRNIEYLFHKLYEVNDKINNEYKILNITSELIKLVLNYTYYIYNNSGNIKLHIGDNISAELDLSEIEKPENKLLEELRKTLISNLMALKIVDGLGYLNAIYMINEPVGYLIFNKGKSNISSGGAGTYSEVKYKTDIKYNLKDSKEITINDILNDNDLILNVDIDDKVKPLSELNDEVIKKRIEAEQKRKQEKLNPMNIIKKLQKELKDIKESKDLNISKLEKLKNDMEEQAKAAEEKAEQAEQAKQQAEQAKQQAEEAKQQAEEDRTKSEVDKQDAIQMAKKAKSEAEKAKSEAEKAKSEAEKAQSEAQSVYDLINKLIKEITEKNIKDGDNSNNSPEIENLTLKLSKFINTLKEKIGSDDGNGSGNGSGNDDGSGNGNVEGDEVETNNINFYYSKDDINLYIISNNSNDETISITNSESKPVKYDKITNNIFANVSMLKYQSESDFTKFINIYKSKLKDNLTKLYLDSYNQQLPQNIFNELDNLTLLSLPKYNQDLPDNIFSGLNNLTILDLPKYNQDLPKNIFNGLNNLTKLYLNSYNNQQLPQNIFNGLGKLT